MTALALVHGLDVAAGACAVVSMLFVAMGVACVRAFAARVRSPPRHRPPVTVLRPLCGDEPMLEAALSSICTQTYPGMQLVFGVQDDADPALLAVETMRRRYPGCDITVVVDGRLHGPNRKISNLMNMLPAARHDVLVFSDSDLHVPGHYVEQVVAALHEPGIGLVTTLCTGLPTAPGPVARLGATGISHSFLPGALMSRRLGREDCLGTTMALRRADLARIGGLNALVRHVADDHVLAKRIRHTGLRVGLASVVPMTAVPERSLGSLLSHELRWARTIRAVEPGLFAMSVLQFPLFWAAACMALSTCSAWSALLFAAAWLLRAVAGRSVDRALPVRSASAAVPLLLLPVRDVASVCLVAASYVGDRVVWRGHVMAVHGAGRQRPLPEHLDPVVLRVPEAAAGSSPGPLR